MPLIEFEGVTYTYPLGQEPALRELTATVESGQVLLVRGPSGSGKSTLLRCLNGLVPHSTGGRFEGRVCVRGMDTRLYPPRVLGSRVGFVFQHPESQFILEDVEAELAFGLENLGLSRSLMRKRIEEVIDQVGINGLRRRRISSLSSGERQRVAIAAALVMHPEVLALDEPTSQLDPQAAEDVLQVVARLVADLGMTTLIAEHRVERIVGLVDRVWTLSPAGRLDDSPPRLAFSNGHPRPPVMELALRARWPELPFTMQEARRLAEPLRRRLGPAPSDGLQQDGPVLARLDQASFSYQEIPALRSVTLSLRGGEVAVLMGRNGSGKTTLLKIVAGLLKPARGGVETGAAVAYIPQDADSLLFKATVAEELEGVPYPNLSPAIASKLDRYPRDLSTGERQQLAIATLSAGARVLLLDEPTRGLDPQAKSDLGDYLRARAAAGAAVLVATHDVEWAARISQRTLLMAEGEIYAEGPPRQVLSDSLVFSTQVNKLLGQGWLLAEEVPVTA